MQQMPAQRIVKSTSIVCRFRRLVVLLGRLSALAVVDGRQAGQYEAAAGADEHGRHVRDLGLNALLSEQSMKCSCNITAELSHFHRQCSYSSCPSPDSKAICLYNVLLIS